MIIYIIFTEVDERGCRGVIEDTMSCYPLAVSTPEHDGGFIRVLCGDISPLSPLTDSMECTIAEDRTYCQGDSSAGFVQGMLSTHTFWCIVIVVLLYTYVHDIVYNVFIYIYIICSLFLVSHMVKLTPSEVDAITYGEKYNDRHIDAVNQILDPPPPISRGVKRVLSLESFKSNKRDPELRGKSLTVDIMAVQ